MSEERTNWVELTLLRLRNRKLELAFDLMMTLALMLMVVWALEALPKPSKSGWQWALWEGGPIALLLVVQAALLVVWSWKLQKKLGAVLTSFLPKKISKQHSNLITGRLAYILPEDWRANLEAKRQRLINKNKSDLEIKLATIWCLIDFLLAAIRIKYENIGLNYENIWLFKEEWHSELEAQRQQLIKQGKSDWYIKLITARCLMEILWAAIQIQWENIWLRRS